MKTIILAALISTGFLAAARAQVNFDQGVNVNSFISQAANTGLAVPEARFSHYTRDCARFSFGPSDAELLSERVLLRSMEYVQECHTVMQPSGPNGQLVPVQQCWDRPGMSWAQSAQVKVLPRKLWPWERESFDVCLDGPWLDIYVNAAGYKYSAKRSGNYDTLFELTPGNKVAMNSDENGLSFGAFSFAGGQYTFTVNDRWAKEYAGEKVAVKVDLYKDNHNWFDGYRGTKEFVFDVAEGYTMTFAAGDLDTSKAAVEPEDRAAKKFYLKWGFKRVGAISKDNFVKKGETPKIEAK